MKKEVVFSHYTVKNLYPTPWEQTWDNLVAFVETFEPTAISMNIKLTLRKVILDDSTEDNLKKGNMVTVSSSDLEQNETPIEDFLTMKLSFSSCDSCTTQQGVKFDCRTLVNYQRKEYQALPKEFFEDIALRLAFKSPSRVIATCTDCSNCTINCEK